ncbi:MAG TPA: metallopeptidase family protein [Polyangiaceae bacterium]|jgi:predicted Zn-dependent protease with MMP-like domain|nr:metallopeptidase family protein [Polyangiaceae bacterium]
MADTEELEDRLGELLEEIAELIEEDPEAALELAEKGDAELSTHPEVRLLRAHALWAAKGAGEARQALEQLVLDHADYADAHAELAAVHEELGDEKKRVEELLIVLDLDTAQDAERGFDASEYEELVVRVATETVEALPAKFRELLKGVPILLAARPPLDLVREGFDPRALGLFEGHDHAAHQNAEVMHGPTRIVLYTANLTAIAETEEELSMEVETTVLHELGHYFGLDDDDLEELGLD